MIKKSLSIYQIDAFTTEHFRGNSAGVAFGDDITNEEKQNIAREMNLAETAFLSKSDNADYKLQWFTPTVEVDLCGHATIASLHFLNEQNLISNSNIKFDTRSGILNCGISDGKYFMQIPVYNTEIFNGNKEQIVEALCIDKNDLDDAVPFIIVDNGYLYIYVKKLETLKNIKPNFKALLNLSNLYKEIEAVAVFTLETIDENSFAHLRFFAPFCGIDEDPVTGSANGPLVLVLRKLGIIQKSGSPIKLTFEQGDFIKRKGRVTVYYDEDKGMQNDFPDLYISGNAVTVLKGELYFTSSAEVPLLPLLSGDDN